jgi:hypothetical protein
MKNELIPLKDYSLDNLSLGELIKRHLEDIGKLPATTITDAPAKSYIAGLTNRSAAYDKAIMKIAFNEESKKIAEADRVRDLSVISLMKAVKVFITSDQAAEMEASRVLLALFNNYKGLTKFDYEKESNGIDNLVADLEGATFSKHVTTLNLTRYITRIKTSNAAFRAVFAGRVSTKAGAEITDTNALRKDLLDYYEECALYFQSMANALPAQAQFLTVLTLLNTARKYYADKLAYHQAILDNKKKDANVPSK